MLSNLATSKPAAVGLAVLVAITFLLIYVGSGAMKEKLYLDTYQKMGNKYASPSDVLKSAQSGWE